MLKIAMCDDSPQDRSKLLEVLKSYAEERKLDIDAAIYSAGEELLADMQEFDIIFLDIEMNGINGIETAQRIRGMDMTMPIVYVTSYSKYWRSAYKVHAFDFISKPYERDDIFAVMDDFLASSREDRSVKIQIETAGGTEIVDTSDVCYLLIQKKKSVIVGLKDGELTSTETLTQLAHKLENEQMFQIHRSCYVNLKYVQNYSRSDGVIMQTGTWLPLARQRQEEFLYMLGKYLRKG
ncbi:MAG: response regulator transcription factor [Ruminococcus sp.]|nr:response regulator transcription factor [Ruminococcus sp.]MBP3796209.1 response regulator transcription factor [Ruminococcus sp.]MBQ1432361.1 response regulator transcription factor [Ruminococcus sp.]